MVGRAVTTVGCRVDWDGWKNLLYGATVVAEEWEGERRWVEIRVDKQVRRAVEFMAARHRSDARSRGLTDVFVTCPKIRTRCRGDFVALELRTRDR